MADREPDYVSCSLAELLDVERRIDRNAYPRRWQRLQDELAKRRMAGEVRAPQRLSRGAYAGLHFVVCPILAGIGGCFLETGGEGFGYLTLLMIPAVAVFSLISLATYSVYETARKPERFLLLSISMTALGVPFVALTSNLVSVFARLR
jgi:hypothetical protein